MRIRCPACAIASIADMKYCKECNGLGYIDQPINCTEMQPECPIFFDAMTNGWECNRCGKSGPL